MSNKEIVADLLERLPDSASLHEIACKIEFVAGVREGFVSYEKEGGVTIEEARARFVNQIKASSNPFTLNR